MLKNKKSVTFSRIIMSVLLTSVSGVSLAQEVQPGDACAAGEAGWYKRSSKATPADGGNMMFCDGATWQSLIVYNATGDLILGEEGAITLPTGTTAQQPTTPTAGMFRYNSDDSAIEFYNGSTWVNYNGTATASAAGSDREIQFNDGGTALGADTNFVYTSDGDFVVGSYQLDDTGTGTEDYRMFYNVSKGAFRSGYTTGSQWNDANVGTYSIATGLNTTASGSSSVALGNSNTASGGASIAMGYDANASNTSSVAIGTSTTSSGTYSLALGRETEASGNYSMAIGLGDATTTAPAVSGASSLGIFMGDQDGITVADANTMAIMGGDFIVGSYQLDDTATGTEDNRMFFDTSKAAFRAGSANDTQWDDANIGDNSFASGSRTIASGGDTTAIGSSSTASGTYATAIGRNNTASGWASTALGYGTRASGSRSNTFGYDTIASGIGSTAFGWSVTAGSGTSADGAGDGSLAVGLIDDAVTITTNPMVTGIQSAGFFMGDQDGVDFAADSTFGIFGGTMVIDPAVPATELAASTGGVQDLELDVEGDIGAINYCDEDGNNCFTAAGISGATVAGNDREIQFNDGGAFGADSAFTYTSAGRLTIGATNNNTFIQGGVETTTGTNNVAFGALALDSLSAAPTNGWESSDNTAIGYRALTANTDGFDNTAVGNNSLYSNTTGDANTAIGNTALFDNETGIRNTANGSASLSNNTSGNSNTAVGYGSLNTNTGMDESTAVGYQSMQYANSAASGTTYNTAVGAYSLQGSTTAADNTGTQNTAVGHSALTANTTGYQNIAIGYNSLADNTTGYQNTAIGRSALRNNETGYINVAVGYYSLFTNTSGYSNTATGISALQNNTSGHENTAIGVTAMVANTTGDNNTALGTASLNTNTGMDESTAVGYASMQYANSAASGTTYNTAVGAYSLQGSTTAADNTGTGNTAVGHSSLSANTEGDNNTALGYNALSANTSGYGNTAVGSRALTATMTSSNYGMTAVGYRAGETMTGSGNTIMGYMAMSALDSGGVGNVAIGFRAGQGTSGYAPTHNVLIGYNSGYSITLANNNTAVGDNSGEAITGGDQNTLLGATTGSTLTTGSDNILIGYGVDTPAADTDEYLNIGGIIMGDIGTTSTDPKIGAYKYCDENLANCFTASGVSGATVAGNDREIQFNDGGAFGSSSNFVYTSEGDLLVVGTYTGTAAVPATGVGTRMFFHPAMGAFRSGSVDGTQWNDSNIGAYSVAMGYGTHASGNAAVALGRYTVSSNTSSTAIGYQSTASAHASTAMGDNTTASGAYSLASGYYATASGTASIALGTSSDASGDYSMALGYEANTSGLYSMAIGLGDATTTEPIVSGANSLGIFMGDQDGIEVADANTMAVLGGDFIVGSYQLDDTTTGNQDNRMFFDVSKGAFRSGGVVGGTWDDANVGANSFATGYNTSASGTYSTAMGNQASASNEATVALGNGANATAYAAVAFGATTSSGTASTTMGWDATASGDYAMAIGLGNATTTNPVVSGESSMGIFMGDQDGYDLTTANRMALVGGDFLIDDDGTAGSEGCIRYLEGTGLQYSHDCTTFSTMGSATVTPAGSDREIQFNDGGTALGADTNFVYTSAGDFIVGSYQLDDTSTGSEDYRMFYDVSKGAFRVGSATGDEWDDANVGQNSMALGHNSRAVGVNSISIGEGTDAIGSTTVALGAYTTANGMSSFAMGYGTTANGLQAIALGRETEASGDYSIALGLGDATTTAPVVSGESSFGIFMGDQDGIEVADANTMAVLGGDFIVGSYQLDDTATGSQDLRMFFDASKGAFRAGQATGVQWDDANVGNYSFAVGSGSRASGASSAAMGYSSASGVASTAMGEGTASGYASTSMGSSFATAEYSTAMSGSAEASGYGSTAIGESIASGEYSVSTGAGTASGDYSVAMNYSTASGNGSTAMGSSTASGRYSATMGNGTIASGISSIAIGASAVAGSGTALDGAGDGSLAVGLIDDAVTITTTPTVTGIQSAGFFMGDQDGVDFAADSTFGIFGGTMVIDPAVPATELAASTGGDQDLELDVEGDIGAINYCDEDGNNCFAASDVGSGVTWPLLAPDGSAAAPSYSFSNYPTSGIYTDTNADLNLASYGNEMIFRTDIGSTFSNDFFRWFQDGTSRMVLRGSTLNLGAYDDNDVYGLDINYGTGNDAGVVITNTYSGDGDTVIKFEFTDDTPFIALGVDDSDEDKFKISAGDLGTNDRLVITTTGDFIVGSYQMDDDSGTTDDNARMFFNKTKGAFRAGEETSTRWDDANVGVGSVALGSGTTASDSYTFAAGRYANASGSNAVALGHLTAASGTTSTAMGESTVASGLNTTALGREATASGDYSIAIGLGDATTSNRIVSGASSMGIFMGDQDAIDVASANTMAVLGGDFIVGSYQLDDTTTGSQDLRMFFDVSKGAFRAGYTSDTDWDDANVGNYSFATGYNTTASGGVSTAMGSSTTASNSYSTAMGFSTRASGQSSTATGYNTTASGNQSAAFGNGSTASGDNSFATGNTTTASGANSFALGRRADVSGGSSVSFGLIEAATTVTTHPIVSGDQSFGIFMGDQDGYDLTTANRMALVGGDFLIDDDGTAGSEGCIRYLEGTGLQYSHDCTTFATMGTATASAAGNDREIQFNNGGSLGASSSFTYTSAGRLVLSMVDETTSLIIGTGNENMTGNWNAVVGVGAGESISSGYGNAYFGSSAGNSSTTGYQNTVVGENAGSAYTDADDNTSIGYHNMRFFTGGGNTAIGSETLEGVSGSSTGTYNTAVGKSAGQVVTSGANNTILGAEVGSTTLATGSNNILIGTSSAVDTPAAGTDNLLNIGNTIYGDLSTGDFIVGSYQLDDTGTGTEDYRMFFDVSKGAFRAGMVDSTEWDDANVGSSSAAFGSGSRASGSISFAAGENTHASGYASTAMGGSDAYGNYSTALGVSATASGQYSTAIGTGSISSGITSTAIGRRATAGSGTAGDGAGDGSLAVGLIDDAVTITTNPMVTGIQSAGFFMGDQDGVDFAADNSFGIFGGTMVIDPAVPATELAASTGGDQDLELDVEGDIGAINYCDEDGNNCFTAASVGGATVAGNDREIQFNDGGAFGSSSNFVYTSEGDLLVMGTYTGTSAVPATGTGTRMFFHPAMAAFRAGYAGGDQWDDTYIGTYSSALGYNNTASGAFSTAFGSQSTASGSYSISMGRTAIASGINSMALGHEVEASGEDSLAFGVGNASTTPLPNVSGSNSIGFFMGDQNGIEVTDANTMSVIGGDFIVGSYQLDDTATGSQDSRMFFDVSKSAFRAGYADTTQWDDANVGDYSFASGHSAIASGNYSFAANRDTEASGSYSTVFGYGTDASGTYSFAAGRDADTSGISSFVTGYNIRVSGDYSAGFGLGPNTSTYPVVSGDSSMGIFMGDQTGVDISTSNVMVIMGGNVGIGDTAPDAELDVAGDIEYTGVLTDMSDRRLKTDIQSLPENQLDKIAALQGVSFKMKDDPEEKTELGLIAQDVQSEFPDLVHEGSDGMLSLNYTGLIAPMVEAIKTLKEENEELRARIEKLEAEKGI